jgi:hypothetical protein
MRRLIAAVAVSSLLSPAACGSHKPTPTPIPVDPLAAAGDSADEGAPDPRVADNDKTPFAKPPPGDKRKEKPTDPKSDASPADPKKTDKTDDKTVPPPAGKASPLKAKVLSSTVDKGLAWLAAHQLKGGGWGQGDESPQMGNSMQKMSDIANVADTSIATLAFLRAGNTARAGKYAANVQAGVDYVVGQVEESDTESLKVTNVTGTRVQMKIGTYADTFAALMMLNEARGAMKDGVSNARVDAALKKIIKKIERTQKDNGQWDNNGWAPVLTQAMAARGLNRAARAGFDVNKTVLARIEQQAAGKFNASTMQFSSEGGAGVEMYGAAATSGALRDDAQTKRQRAEKMKEAAKAHYRDNEMKSPDAPTPAEIGAAEAEAKKAEKQASDSDHALAMRTMDSKFTSGFGNNGGEEYLSYLFISETLVQKHDDTWLKWDEHISKMVDKVQNSDGSWTGMHCITGRTFCTAAALLVLMGDRAPITQIAS